MTQSTVVTDVTPATLRALSNLPFLSRPVLRLASGIDAGTITVTLRDGRRLRVGGHTPGPEGEIVIKDDRVWRRWAIGGDIGFAETYLDGLWDTPDLTALIEIAARNMDGFGSQFGGHPLHRLMQRVLHIVRPNSRTGSRRNIMAHYDLGNAFFSRWLDPTMTYSSAVFASPEQDLATAQANKYRALAERIDLRPDEHVLEIGSGWGGFAEFAGREIGARVTTITISPSQFEFAKQRIFEAGLSERVEVRLQDYRDVDGRFDSAASIEMFEAVGRAYWPVFFNKLRDVVRPGGIIGIQAIAIRDDLYGAYRQGADFIQRYVFPGGFLPSPSALRRTVEDAGLNWVGADGFGHHYAETLRRWQVDFHAAWNELADLGFDERFRRLWSYYLSYCEGGFRAGNIDVLQVSLRRG